ncbi:insulin-like growth factor-binding protein 7 isoform X1 [Caretta caretta]|uniref:insulin-like growth factor-binding protein 7 isoform X1 n=1 Tax=Caretta caretta TaxID=8467 RepID=UPI003F4B8BA0
MLRLLSACLLLLGARPAAGQEPSGAACGPCLPALCPALPARGCALGRARDACGCCWRCARGEGEPCGAGARCAAGLECAPRPGRAGPPALCVCKSRYPVCGSDDVTYPSACRLRAAALSAQRRGQRGPSLRRKGACEQDTDYHGCYSENCKYRRLDDPAQEGPSIVTPPKEIWNVTGAKIYLSCEVMGIPTPVLTWNKIIRGQYGVQRLELLPGDRDNLAIQTRGGPEKHEVTGWVLISPLSKEDAGEYECHASNSKGEATASARITVNALHENTHI